ncbi:MAG: Crp/Fnr family transcriptional regulator [Acidobacteriia bacterium]|nr:Crp/Fnr family transcriptional regulator [Terriglobia bacterium]
MPTIREQIAQSLSRVQLFAELSADEIHALAARAVRKIYSAGETLFMEGEPCQGFYVIVSGKVRIFKLSPGGREHVLAMEGAGGSIAELPVFDGGPYPASATALERTECIFVARNDFQAFCRQHPEVALKVLSIVGARLRRLVGIIEELSFTTVRQRLISVLLRFADSGRKTARGIEFELAGSHQQLANEIGTVRELVSRNLTRLQAEGLIEFYGRHIVVPSKEALAEQMIG